MAVLITDIKEFERVSEQHKKISTKLVLRLSITRETVQSWKEDGYFKHIRSQLRSVNGIYIMCKTRLSPTDTPICDYWFICGTEQLASRVFDMINSYLRSGMVKTLQESSNSALIEDQLVYVSHTYGNMNITCNLL